MKPREYLGFFFFYAPKTPEKCRSFVLTKEGKENTEKYLPFRKEDSSIRTMGWLYAAISAIVVGFIRVLYRYLRSAEKKAYPFLDEGMGWAFSSFCLMAANALLLLIIQFAFTSSTAGNVALFCLMGDALLAFLPYGEWVSAFRAKKMPSPLKAEDFTLILALTLVAVFEIVLFNRRSLGSSPFVFSSLRYGFLSALVYLVIRLPRWIKNPCKSLFEIAKRPYLVLGLSALFLGVVFLVLVRSDSSRFLTQYPFQAKDRDSNPFLYYNLFEAFKNGQLSLLETPPAALASLNNPYDPSSRSGISYFWDTVYYNGQYYCYYGPAPVILVMFPVYWLSGSVPTGLFLEALALLGFVIGFVHFSLRLAHFTPQISFPLWFFLTVVGLFSCLCLNFVTYRLTDWKYSLPFDYGLLFAVWFLGMILWAYQVPRRRMLALALAGFFFVGIMASRPDLGVVLLPALPFLFKMLFASEKPWGKRLLDFAPMFLFVLCGAALLIAYNVLRYGKVLEFGQSYQLTVIDPSTLHLSAKGILGSFLHYWVCPWRFSSSFPYFGVTSFKTAFDAHPYDAGAVGIFMMPFFYGIFLLPRAMNRSDSWIERLFYPLLLLCPLVTSFSIYCLGGTCARYLLGIWPLVSFCSLAVLFKTLPSFEGEKKRAVIYPLVVVLGTVSLLFALCLAFNGFDGLGIGESGLLTKWISAAFAF